MQRVKIGKLDDLQKRRTLKFRFNDEGIDREGFVAWFKGAPVAYENSCRHIPVTLDYGDNRFFTPDGALFICQTHGAEYDPATGICVRGPCPGAALRPLRVEVLDGIVWYIAHDEHDAR